LAGLDIFLRQLAVCNFSHTDYSRKQKPELSTSVVTSVIIYVFVITFVTLELWLSALATLGTAIGWTILAYQRWKQPKENNKTQH
jgi:hypothetical protein